LALDNIDSNISDTHMSLLNQQQTQQSVWYIAT